jgi:hypothetical protein
LGAVGGLGRGRVVGRAGAERLVREDLLGEGHQLIGVERFASQCFLSQSVREDVAAENEDLGLGSPVTSVVYEASGLGLHRRAEFGVFAKLVWREARRVRSLGGGRSEMKHHRCQNADGEG